MTTTQDARRPERAPAPRFKMRLADGTFDAERGGRLPAGAVLIVDEDTAIRWLENGIAEQAAADAPTFRQQRRAEVAARLVPLPSGVYDEAITSSSFGPTPTAKTPPRRQSARGQGRAMLDPGLAGAGIINDAADTPDDDDDDAGDE